MKTFYSAPLMAILMVGLAACEKRERVEITQTVERSPHRYEPKVDASSQERFQLARMRTPSTGAEHAPMSREAVFHWSTPDGWTELPPTEFRQANFRIGPEGEGEVYMSTLPNLGGGLLANVNRWRNQMGLDEMSQTDFDLLPRFRVLGQEAVYIDFDGTYTGMGASGAQPDARMVGLLMDYFGTGVFLKMVGSKDVVSENERPFQTWVGSLHSAADGHTHGPEVSTTAGDAMDDLPHDHPPIGDMPQDALHTALAQGLSDSEPIETPSEDGAQGLTWTVPEGWQKMGERMMRVATYTMGDDNKTECYVTVLGGAAGGALMNINRWLDQFQSPPLTEGEIAELPTITVLGKQVPLIEVEGAYTDMQGQTYPDQAFLGIAWIDDDGSVFVRMTGPPEEVKRQKDNFVAFCQSLKQDA